jgi:sporulation protein YlmC with PRC-barrel domain
VYATDGEVGRVEDVELDAETGELDAFWVRAGHIFRHDMRIPAEWIERVDDAGIHVAGTKLDIEAGLGPSSDAMRVGQRL